MTHVVVFVVDVDEVGQSLNCGHQLAYGSYTT
jgi:hypothetical protein